MKSSFNTDFCRCTECVRVWNAGARSEDKYEGPITPESEIVYESPVKTPWAVQCRTCGLVHLSRHGYLAQMMRPDSRWICPSCGENASWNDDNHEAWLTELGAISWW